MTDTPTTDLTAPEAVERLARVIERHQTRKRQNHARNPRYQPPDERYEPIPDTLRALSAALEAEKARAEALDAKLKEAVAVINCILEAHESGWPDGQDWGAGNRARAALRDMDTTP